MIKIILSIIIINLNFIEFIFSYSQFFNKEIKDIKNKSNIFVLTAYNILIVGKSL